MGFFNVWIMYTRGLGQKICERIAKGESVITITTDEDMPCEATIYNWLIKYPEFLEDYTRAREAQAEHYLDEIIEIADNCTDDVELIRTQDGEDYRIKQSAISRAKLQVETRKWVMGKLAAKKYGDKLQNEHSGQIALTNLTKEQKDAAVAAASKADG
jgi:hypothetical protein